MKAIITILFSLFMLAGCEDKDYSEIQDRATIIEIYEPNYYHLFNDTLICLENNETLVLRYDPNTNTLITNLPAEETIRSMYYGLCITNTPYDINGAIPIDFNEPVNIKTKETPE